jgi:transposase-like protein
MKLSDPIFTDAEASREWMEAQRWPNGPVCPHCGNADPERITSLKGKAHRPGLYQCNEPECREQFTVMVGSIYERSKIPLNKWLLATFLVMSSKKGMSTRQIQRMLGVSLKSTWFMTHRIREALKDGGFLGPLGGLNAVVEADETFIGGKAKNRAFKPEPKKHAVMTLVERDGGAMSFHIANVTATTLRPIIVKHASRASHLMTDENLVYVKLGREFAGHSSVNHSADEYVRLGGFAHTNTAENFFSILKRGIYGVYHHVSEAHLHRYLAEFDFRYSIRHLSDTERTALAVKGAEGKRLVYQRPRSAAHA